MAYLYAGLGVAMLTGIMAMFEMAMSYNQFENAWEPSKASRDLSKEYFGGSFASIDASISDAIKSGLVNNVCEKARAAGVPRSLFKDNNGKQYLSSDYKFHETISSLPYGCYYQLLPSELDIGHRIIFDKNDGLWSCALLLDTVLGIDDYKCDFEK